MNTITQEPTPIGPIPRDICVAEGGPGIWLVFVAVAAACALHQIVVQKGKS